MKIESNIEKFLNSIVFERNLTKMTLLLNSNGQNLINGGKTIAFLTAQSFAELSLSITESGGI